jgi:hypothetical protein
MSVIGMRTDSAGPADEHPREIVPTDPAVIYDEDGVDMSLIRWTLSLTPAERLQVLQGAVNSVLRMRDAARG